MSKSIEVTGIGTGTIEYKGHNPIFGECHYFPDAPVNILSFSKCREKFEIYYSYSQDLFKLVPISKSLKKICPPLIFKDDGSEEGLYKYCKHLTKNPELIVAMPGIMKEIKFHTPEQVRIAQELRKLHKALAHPSDEALAKLLENGGIMDTQLNRRSVSLANEVLGECQECIEAKATDATSIRDHNYESRSNPPDKIGDKVWRGWI